MIEGKGRYMGLGSSPEVSLADARREAERCRRLVRDDTDPIDARRARRQAVSLNAARSPTFESCAKQYIEDHRAGWRNEKHAAQWSATLATYAYPAFGSLPIQSIDTALVIKALDPIWRRKPETAARVRQRIESVLDWAAARGYREGENPARWRGHLDKLLPKRARIRAVKHHEAMPYTELPAFFVGLTKRDTISAKALKFTILTAARSAETRGATWGEIDRAASLWIVPASRIKSGRQHRVPLPDAALSVLDDLELLSTNRESLLFPGRRGKVLSDSAMRNYLQEDLRRPGLTVHGFRSSFRDWAAEKTGFPRELAEAALAHVVRDRTEAAYQRGDLLDRRRKLMDAWSKFCTSGIGARSEN